MPATDCSRLALESGAGEGPGGCRDVRAECPTGPLLFHLWAGTASGRLTAFFWTLRGALVAGASGLSTLRLGSLLQGWDLGPQLHPLWVQQTCTNATPPLFVVSSCVVLLQET
eukprot:4808216-Prymnesium_polylepis.1